MCANPWANLMAHRFAFKYSNRDVPGPASQTGESLYIVAPDGVSQPTKVNLSNITDQQLSSMTLMKWV